MPSSVSTLLEAAHHGPDSLTSWLHAHSQQLTPALAEEAHAIYRQAMEARDFQKANDAIIACYSVYLAVGDRPNALANYLNFLELRFYAASTLDQYRELHGVVREFLPRTQELKSNELTFHSAVLAADIAYFAAQSQGDSLADTPEWIQNALDDLITASAYAARQTDKDSFPRFVSIVGAAVASATARPWVEQVESGGEKEPRVADFTSRLQRLATAVEALVPNDFAYADPARSSSIAGELAALSYEYGTPALADERLETAMARAEQARDFDGWLAHAFQRYNGARRLSDPGTLLSLRGSLLKRMDGQRLQYHSRAGRLWVAQSHDTVLGAFLRDEFKQPMVSESDFFQMVEMGKARVLLDFMAGRYVGFSSPQLTTRAAELERQFLRFAPGDAADQLTREARLVSQLTIGFPGLELFQAGQAAQAERSHSLSLIESLFAQNQAGLQSVESAAELAEVMQALQPDEALIEYCYPAIEYTTEPVSDLFILAITSRQASLQRLSYQGDEQTILGRLSVDGQEPMEGTVLGNPIVTARLAIQDLDEQTALDSLAELHRILIAPLVERGLKPQDFKRWIIVPHGMLHDVPFVALMDGEGRHLIQDVAVSVVPSASVWLRLARHAVKPPDSFLGMANAVRPDSVPLPEAEAELAHIAQSLGSLQVTTYVGKEATETRLRDEVKGQSIVHFATHGDFPQMDAIDFHQILLTPSTGHDGRLTGEELRQMDLRSARLVVLSICNGGIYRFGPGDEPYGLVSAVLSAGAENILGTLWPIEDRVGRAFMDEFYKHLLTDGPAEALRQTCIRAIQDLGVCRDWAAFTLVGPGRRFS